MLIVRAVVTPDDGSRHEDVAACPPQTESARSQAKAQSGGSEGVLQSRSAFCCAGAEHQCGNPVMIYPSLAKQGLLRREFVGVLHRTPHASSALLPAS